MAERQEVTITVRGDLSQLEQQVNEWAANKIANIRVGQQGAGGGGGTAAAATGGTGGTTASSVVQTSSAAQRGTSGARASAVPVPQYVTPSGPAGASGLVFGSRGAPYYTQSADPSAANMRGILGEGTAFTARGPAWSAYAGTGLSGSARTAHEARVSRLTAPPAFTGMDEDTVDRLSNMLAQTIAPAPFVPSRGYHLGGFPNQTPYGPPAPARAMPAGYHLGGLPNQVPYGPPAPPSRMQSFMSGMAPYTPYLEGAMITASMAGQNYFSALINERMTGRTDIMGEAGASGAFTGGIIGTLLGAPLGGAGAYVGSFAGSTIGTMLSQFLVSGQARDIQLQSSLIPTAALSANRAGDRGGVYSAARNQGTPLDALPPVYTGERFRNPAKGGIERLSHYMQVSAKIIGRAFWQPLDDIDENRWQQYYMTAEQMSQVYSSGYSALTAGGFDPEMRMNLTGAGQIAGGLASSQGEAMLRNANRSGGIVQGVVGYGLAMTGMAVAKLPPNLIEYLTENAAAKYGAGGVDAFQSILPILGSLRSVGGNISSSGFSANNMLDILMKFGPQTTATFYDTITSMGKTPQFGINQLRGITGEMQGFDYRLRSAATGVRNVGGNTEAILKEQMGYLESEIPGVRSSITYRTMDNARRSAMFAREREEDLPFNIRSIDYSAKKQEAAFLPFNPAYTMRVALGDLMNISGQIKTARSRYREHIEAGDYSEGQQEAAYANIRSMEVQRAQGIATLSAGGENRVMALSAYRPGFFNRMDSAQLAATSVFSRGGPTMAYGSVSRSQRQFQRSFVDAFSTDTFSAEEALNPRSTTAGMNGSMEMVKLNENLRILNSTLDRALNGTSSGTLRPGEARGAARATQDTTLADPRKLYEKSN